MSMFFLRVIFIIYLIDVGDVALGRRTLAPRPIVRDRRPAIYRPNINSDASNWPNFNSDVSNEFVVFYDLYDLVELAASSVAVSRGSSSMLETADSSIASKSSSGGGFQISMEDLNTAAEAFQLSAKGLNATQRAFSHSELVFCESSQFGEDEQTFLSDNLGKIIPETWNEKEHRSAVRCFSLGYGCSACTQPGCAIGASRVALRTVNQAYGLRYRIPLGVTTQQGTNPTPSIINLIKTKKDQWKGTDYSFVEHNCNTFARYVVRCVLQMRMPNGFRLGVNHAVSSATWSKWFTSIGATIVGGLLGGPVGLVAGPIIFMAMPGKFCD